jgi:hypothetical protein
MTLPFNFMCVREREKRKNRSESKIMGGRVLSKIRRRERERERNKKMQIGVN